MEIITKPELVAQILHSWGLDGTSSKREDYPNLVGGFIRTALVTRQASENFHTFEVWADDAESLFARLASMPIKYHLVGIGRYPGANFSRFVERERTPSIPEPPTG